MPALKDLEITDEQIAGVFKGTNFGPEGETPEGRKRLIAEATFKRVCNYDIGYTMSCILLKLDLMNDKKRPSIMAVRWIHKHYNGENK